MACAVRRGQFSRLRIVADQVVPHGVKFAHFIWLQRAARIGMSVELTMMAIKLT